MGQHGLCIAHPPDKEALTDAGRAVPSCTPRRSAPPAATCEGGLLCHARRLAPVPARAGTHPVPTRTLACISHDSYGQSHLLQAVADVVMYCIHNRHTPSKHQDNAASRRVYNLLGLLQGTRQVTQSHQAWAPEGKLFRNKTAGAGQKGMQQHMQARSAQETASTVAVVACIRTTVQAVEGRQAGICTHCVRGQEGRQRCRRVPHTPARRTAQKARECAFHLPPAGRPTQMNAHTGLASPNGPPHPKLNLRVFHTAQQCDQAGQENIA
jgi:hypothetical protein